MASAQSYSDVSEFLSGFGLTYGRPMIEALNTVELRLGVPPGSIAAMAPRAGAERPALEWRFQRNAVRMLATAQKHVRKSRKI